MYINPFLAGIIATLMAEAFSIVLYAIFSGGKEQ